MTLRSLEVFVAVAQNRNMTAASEQLHISQPTVSKSITELERELEVALFTRLSKRLYITDAGEQLLLHAQAMLAEEYDLKKSMAGFAQKKRIAFGATLTVGQYVAVGLISAFETQNERVELSVRIDNTEAIEKLLLGSELDLALVEGTVKSDELFSEPVLCDELLLVCHKDYPLARHTQVLASELSDYAFIMREKGSGTREMFECVLAEHKVCIHTKWNCRSSDSMIEALLAGQGAAVLSRRIVDKYIAGKALVSVDIIGVSMKRHFSLVYHKSKAFTTWTRQFITYIKQFEG